MLAKTKYPEVCLIVAMTENGLIGRNGALPWNSQLDMKWFKNHTMGRPTVFGLNTARGMSVFPLQNRPAAVISRSIREPYYTGNNGAATVLRQLGEAPAHFAEHDKIFICGGGRTYYEAMRESVLLQDGMVKPLVDTVIRTIFRGTDFGKTNSDVRFVDKNLIAKPNFKRMALLHYEHEGCYYNIDERISYYIDPADSENTKKNIGNELYEAELYGLNFNLPFGMLCSEYIKQNAGDTLHPTIRFEVWKRQTGKESK